jgi:hypothetical protein
MAQSEDMNFFAALDPELSSRVVFAETSNS